MVRAAIIAHRRSSGVSWNFVNGIKSRRGRRRRFADRSAIPGREEEEEEEEEEDEGFDR